jgi:hypothetical protein
MQLPPLPVDVSMRKPFSASAGAKKVPASGSLDAAGLVCLALVLALIVLVSRIASIW